MKAIVCSAPGKINLAAIPDPEPPPGWARVCVKAAGICATDFEVLTGGIAASYPATPGHEWSGIVDRIGDEAHSSWIGKRVSGHNEVTCLSCDHCRSGEWRRCSVYRQIGFELAGAYAEYLLVPVHNLFELDHSVSFEQGCLIEPLGVGIAVARMAAAHIGVTAIILGAGPVGLNCLAALTASGAIRVLCLDQREDRLALARRWGASHVFTNTDGLLAKARKLHARGTDIVVEAAGAPELLRGALNAVRPGGSIVLAGYFRRASLPFVPDLIHEKNVRVLGAGNNAGLNAIAALAAGDGVLQTEEMITHRFTLDQFCTALARETARQPSYIKGIFTF